MQGSSDTRSDELIDETVEESFPASDAPSWTLVGIGSVHAAPEDAGGAPPDTGGSDMQPKAENAPGYNALTLANEALGDLLSREVADGAAWVRDVRGAAGKVFEALNQHQAHAEGEEGILHDATERRPALVPLSEHMTREHEQMLHHAREIQREAEFQLASEDFDLELIRLKAAVLRSLVQLHLREAGSLTYEAYYRVEGGEGG